MNHRINEFVSKIFENSNRNLWLGGYTGLYSYDGIKIRAIIKGNIIGHKKN